MQFPADSGAQLGLRSEGLQPLRWARLSSSPLHRGFGSTLSLHGSREPFSRSDHRHGVWPRMSDFSLTSPSGQQMETPEARPELSRSVHQWTTRIQGSLPSHFRGGLSVHPHPTSQEPGLGSGTSLITFSMQPGLSFPGPNYLLNASPLFRCFCPQKNLHRALH